jgi:hypothetical protein
MVKLYQLRDLGALADVPAGVAVARDHAGGVGDPGVVGRVVGEAVGLGVGVAVLAGVDEVHRCRCPGSG